MEIVKIDDSRFRAKQQQVIEQIGKIVEKEMKERAPKELGTMSESIKAFPGVNEVYIRTVGIPYAMFVEYGTQSMIQAHGPHIPEAPVTEWEALRKRHAQGSGQTMPFARSANFFTEERRLKVFSDIFSKSGTTKENVSSDTNAATTLFSGKKVPSSMQEVKSKGDYWNYRKSKIAQGRKASTFSSWGEMHGK